MNRQLVFRAKAIKNGEWVSGELHLKTFPPYIQMSMLETAHIDVETIGQFTGWRDKNDKPIFEGDILSLIIPDGSPRLFVVEWHQQLRHLKSLKDFVDDGNAVEIAGWCFRWGNNLLFPSHIGHVSDYKRMEVIGNIYDNPELLSDEVEASITGKPELIGNTVCLSNKPGVQVFMYDLNDEHGDWLARVFLTSDGVYMSYSEFGNFFHYFNAPGKEGIRKFMLGISPGYFGGKLCEVEWNTAPKKVAAAATRHAQHVLPALQQAIREQLEHE